MSRKLGEPKIRKLYARIAKEYTETYWGKPSPYDKYVDKFLAYLPKGAKILDAGCGSGDSSYYFLKRGFRVDGIDTSPEMLVIARKKVPNAKFRLMDLRNLTFAAETFDGVYSYGATEHTPKKEFPKVLRGYSKVLKKGGYLFINPPHGHGQRLTYWPLAKQKFMASYYTIKELNALFNKTGFQIVHYKILPPHSKYYPGSTRYKLVFTIARKVK